MSETTTTTKFTDEELSQVKDLRNKYNEKIVLLGQLKLEQLKIEDAIKNLTEGEAKLKDTENALKSEFIELQKNEAEFLTKITSKYGQGSLNPVTGEFSPQKVS